MPSLQLPAAVKLALYLIRYGFVDCSIGKLGSSAGKIELCYCELNVKLICSVDNVDRSTGKVERSVGKIERSLGY